MDTDQFIIKKYGAVIPPRGATELQISRNDLATLFNDLKFVRAVEVGVERGLYSEVLLNANPSLKLYLVDPWEVYRGYREHVDQEKMLGFIEETKQRLAGKNYQILKKYSMDALEFFEDESLDFVYIDGNHDFVNTAKDIDGWSKKVRVGGIVSGHDYNRNKKKDYMCHVKDVVQGWTYSHGIFPWYVLKGDKSPSWMYVKK